jgi:hypothetical protein
VRKRYAVVLSEQERARLHTMIGRGVAPASALTHARILLKANQGEAGPGWTDAAVGAALEVNPATVARVRMRYVAAGLEAAVYRKPPARSYRRRLDGEQEARLVALTCSAPPEGHKRWTLRLLADRLVALGVVESDPFDSPGDRRRHGRCHGPTAGPLCWPPPESRPPTSERATTPQATRPRGRSPDRAGPCDPARSPGSMADPPRERRIGRTPTTTTDLPMNGADAAGVTYQQADAPGREGARRPRAFASQTETAPGSSQPGPFVEHVTEGALRCLPPLHRLRVPARFHRCLTAQRGAKRPPP